MLVLFCAAVVLLTKGATGQEDPWPPLVTTCDVMPLVAADANNYGSDLVACSSSAWPVCETINCQIRSNNDQLEMELLPCWQHPAMWFKNRGLDGKILFQDIFDSSRMATANIGGESVQLNVTVVQRGITMGFGVDVVVPGSGPRTIIPYRDIPLNITECGGGSPGYPLMCRMILYMEQYIITTYSGLTRDPAMVPQCERPDTKSCDWMRCSWNSSTPTVQHSFRFLPCAKPQAFRLIMTASEGVVLFNETFTESRVVKMSGIGVNVTIKRPMDQTLAIKVDLITQNDGTITEIPYTVLPLETNGCPPPPFQTRPSHHSDITLYKHGRKGMLANVAPPRHEPSPQAAPHHKEVSPKVSATNQTPPLINTCDVMAEIATSLSSAPDGILTCMSAPSPNCNRINCTIDSGESLEISFMSCHNPPSVHLITSYEDTVFTNMSVSGSGVRNIDLYNISIPLNFTVVQHTDFLTMGIMVDAMLLGNITLLPYQEIPMNRSSCPGAIEPSMTCSALRNIATYGNVRFLWDCRVSSDCNNLTCSYEKNMAYYSFLISPCDHTLTIEHASSNSTHFRETFHRTRLLSLDNTTQLNVLVLFNATTSTLAIQISVVYRDAYNQSISLTVTVIPHTIIPLDLRNCRASPLVRSCDVFPHIADDITNVVPNVLTCVPAPRCSGVTCNVVSNNATLSMRILPCHDPPAIQLAIRIVNGTVTFNTTFVTTKSVVAQIGDDVPAVMINITIAHHRENLTLGIAISANIVHSGKHMDVDFLPYHEVPLNRTGCMANQTSTCRVVGQIAQYLNVFYANSTHSPTLTCYLVPDSLCQNITCPDTQDHSVFNISFLPCGDRIGYYIASNSASASYSFTVFNSTTVRFSESVTGEITLEQGTSGSEITLQMDLYRNGSYAGTEVPRVVIPVDKEVCKVKPPATNNTIDITPLTSTCDVFPHIADVATNVSLGSIFCTSSSPPNCDHVICNILSNNATLSMRILPCHDPPAIQLAIRKVNGTVTFNETFVNTTKSVTTQIGNDPSMINITIVQNEYATTLGVAINATITHLGQIVLVDFLPFTAIPLNRTLCSTTDTDTCRVMDNIGQYLSVFLSELTHSPDKTPNCGAVRNSTSLCNTMACEAPTYISSLTFIPCSDPIGLTSRYMNNNRSLGHFAETLYSSGVVNISSDQTLGFTLNQLSPGVVGLAITLNVLQGNHWVSLTELPYVHVPVNTSPCGNHPGNHSQHHSLIDACDVLPILARTATNSLPEGITCTSSNCQTISCIGNGRQWEFTIYSCWVGQYSPSLGVSVSNTNGTYLVKDRRVTSSKEISVGGQMLSVKIITHSSNLSMGLEVSGTFASENRTFIPYKEIPLDRTACPSTQTYSEVCTALRNISQYVNFVISNVTGQPTDCDPDESCDGVTCNVGNYSSLTVSIIRCSIPPALRASLTNSNGTTVFNRTVVDSEVLTWDVLSAVLTLNVTVQHYSASTIGLQVTFEYPGSPGTLVLVPMIVFPVETTGCGTHPTYSNHPLVTPCDIAPYIAASVFPPQAISSLQCTASPPPNCSTITCSVPGTHDSVSFILEPCFSPPAITIENYVNGTLNLRKSFSHSEKFNFSTAKIPMMVSLTQHTDMLSLGFKVDVLTDDNTQMPFIPYREIPVSHYECTGSILSPTCRVMGHVAQYITVFIANATTDADSTPSCYPDRRSLCNNITCINEANSQRYNYSFLVCEDPIAFSISHGFIDGSFIMGFTFNKSQQIMLMGQYGAQLTLNSLSEYVVQFKIELNPEEDVSGTFVPMVNVPLDSMRCRRVPPATTPTASSVTDDTKLIIAVAVPIGSILTIVIVVLLSVLAYYCCTGKKMSNEPYSYRPLSNRADTEDDEGEEGDDRGPLSGSLKDKYSDQEELPDV